MNKPWPFARLIPWLALGALVLLFAWRLAFTNGILARGDLLLYFYPYWEYRAEALAAGRLPLWNPLLFMGAPFLANSQAGVLYPLNWPLTWLTAPVAVKVSVLFHLGLAAVGAYTFGRRAARLGDLAAFMSAGIFALGGYLTAQIEHVNQLQGLAWLPWLMLGAHGLAEAGSGRVPRVMAASGMGVVLALQLLAGHIQTAFISLAGASVYALALAWKQSRIIRSSAGMAAGIAGVAALAALLAAAQLLPTLELSGQSLRSGGLALREALSFSLDPRLLGRSLLPGYSRAMFSEFVGYIGVAGLVLAVLGLAPKRSPVALAVVAGMGLLFALGYFNPAYVGLAALPPFNLFRAPARWLALAAFGGALLAGAGLETLAAALTARRRWLALAAAIACMALTPLAVGLTPAGETGPLGWPGWSDWAGWGLALIASAALLWWRRPGPARMTAFAAMALAELFLAGRALSFNHVSTPEAYTSIRPAMTQLLADQMAGGPVPARFLSMSGLRFDPGDLAELLEALEDELPADALFDFIVATKHKEVLSPNLPLAWGVPAVDGYDGGVLPLRTYAAFTTLFAGAASADGRLRENIIAVPDPRLLALLNARYLITDKVRDAWIEGVFYDLEFEVVLTAGERAEIAFVPPFQTTAIGLVADNYSGRVEIVDPQGQVYTLPITASRVRLLEPTIPVSMTLTGPLTLRGLSLVDERSGAFQTLTLGPYRLVHSGDVKVYENLAVLPRAFVATAAIVADDTEALALLSDVGFDPAHVVVLAGRPPRQAPASPPLSTDGVTAAITRYAPEALTVRATGPGYLVLTDAHYPGWRATIDGIPADILRADVMFRAVSLPEGEHTIEFRYQPAWVSIGLVVSGVAWAGIIAALLVTLRRRRAP